jgi:hypothetical protein
MDHFHLCLCKGCAGHGPRRKPLRCHKCGREAIAMITKD